MTMAGLGDLALGLAFVSSAYGVAAGFFAYARRSWRALESMRGAQAAVALSYTAAVFALEYLLMMGDFSVRAVYNHTDQTLPLAYKLGALWGGNSGSVLFWGWILSLYAAYLVWHGFDQKRQRVNQLALPIMGLGLLFFSGLSLLGVNPFMVVAGLPGNGAGLDPLLRNPVMVIHPPAMYTGLVGLIVPTALMASALWQRVPWRYWLADFRRWLMFSWLCLGAALILGGMWAYLELGWGGYWEWDPVENAALLPWLTATAALHALQRAERNPSTRWWTASLTFVSYLLTLVGTYITRSGVLKNSVHSFTGSGVGPYFVVLFWVSAVGLGVLFWLRRDMLFSSERRGVGEDNLHRMMIEVLSVLAAVVLLGTFYPVISKAFFHQTVVLTQQFFNTAAAPLLLTLVLLMGLSPMLFWRAAARERTKRFMVPAVAGASLALFAALRGYRYPMAIIGVALVGFSLSSMLRELWVQAGRSGRLSWGGILANRRRAGGFVAHTAFLIAALGVIGSHTNVVSTTRTLAREQSISVAGYQIRFDGLHTKLVPGSVKTDASFTVGRNKHEWVQRPGMSFFSDAAQPVADVSIHQGLMQNLYLVLEATTTRGAAMVEVMVNPMVTWIWLALPVLLFGTLLAMSAPQGNAQELPPVAEGSLWISPIQSERDPL